MRGRKSKMEAIIRKIGDTARPNRLIPTIIKSQLDKMVYNFTAPQMKQHVLLHGKLGNRPVFCIVHWNAPDFLLLNVSQIETLYPNSRIYVLDNGSQQANINVIEKGLKRFNNVTLFAAAPRFPNWARKLGVDRYLFSHTKGLQFLLNYAAEKKMKSRFFLIKTVFCLTILTIYLSNLVKMLFLSGQDMGKRITLCMLHL